MSGRMSEIICLQMLHFNTLLSIYLVLPKCLNTFQGHILLKITQCQLVDYNDQIMWII